MLDTPAESKWFIFSPLNMDGYICVCVQGAAGIKMKVMKAVVQVHRAQGGGDLGCGGDCREGPAICLGPGRCDPASLFGPTEHTRVTGRDIPPDWGIVSEF